LHFCKCRNGSIPFQQGRIPVSKGSITLQKGSITLCTGCHLFSDCSVFLQQCNIPFSNKLQDNMMVWYTFVWLQDHVVVV
jgi:hypothetical protein